MVWEQINDYASKVFLGYLILINQIAPPIKRSNANNKLKPKIGVNPTTPRPEKAGRTSGKICAQRKNKSKYSGGVENAANTCLRAALTLTVSQMSMNMAGNSAGIANKKL